MKKSRVLSIRLPLEALQSCFDLSDMVGAPTTVAGTAIARSISLLTANMRKAGKLPVYTDTELEKITEKWAAKINPSSMPSLEQSSLCDVSLLSANTPLDSKPRECNSQDFPEADKAFDPYQSVGIPPGYDPKTCSVGSTGSSIDNIFDETDLEDEIARQVKELELEDELDLLDKILII